MLEGLGEHPYDAEKWVTEFVEQDRRALIRFASVYDPAIPSYENEAYLKLARELTKESDQILKGIRTTDMSQVSRAWMRPGKIRTPNE